MATREQVKNYILNQMSASGGPKFKSTADVFNYVNPNTLKNSLNSPVFTDLRTIGPLFDEQGQFTEEFKDLKPKGFGKSQDDVLENILDNIDRLGVDVDPLQKLILEKQLEKAKEGEQISNLINQMGLVNPELQMGPQTAFFDSGMFLNPFNIRTTDTPTVDPGIQALFAQRQAQEDRERQAREQAILDEAERDQRAQNAAKAQESRNQSRDDYTGGGGTVTIGTGGGESKVVSPRSREAMYSPTPQRSSSRGPDLRKRATGGLVELEGDTTQNNPNMLPPLAGRRGPFPVGGGGGLASILQPGFPSDNPPFMGRPLFPPGLVPRPGPIMPMPLPGPRLPEMPDYSSQFEQLGETLGGFGEQLGGFGKQIDALGSFNEQVGGLGKQFESVNNKLDSLEKGLGSLGNQLASIEQGQPKPQEVQQPQQPSYSPFGFGGLANLFMNMRRF